MQSNQNQEYDQENHHDEDVSHPLSVASDSKQPQADHLYYLEHKDIPADPLLTHNVEDLLEEELRSDEGHPSQFMVGGAKTNGNLSHHSNIFAESALERGNNKRLGYVMGSDEEDDLELSHHLLDARGDTGKMSYRSSKNYELDDDQQALLNDLQHSYGNGLSDIPLNKWRAKLYQLNGSGSWDDFGTGEFSLVKDDQGEYYMQLIDEDDKVRELLRMKISSSSSLQRQRDTIITWLYEEEMIDFALSFQDCKGAQETWESICIIQGKDPDEGYQAEVIEEEELLPASADNLSQIVEDITSNNDLLRKRKISALLTKENCAYLKKMGDIFEKAEELENQESLFLMFHFFKGVLSLGDSKLIETLLSKELFVTTLGALEYDPEVIQSPTQSRHEVELEQHEFSDSVAQQQANNISQTLKHRDFLQNELKFKEVVKIDDEQILDYIHLVYRLTYLKDTAIARFIDDQVLANINSLIYMKSQEIVNHIFYNKDILSDLYSKMRSHEDLQTKHDAIDFFMEVCQLSKNLQLNARFACFESINSFSLIEILAETFNIYQPNTNTLKAEALQNQDALIEELLQHKEISTLSQSDDQVKQYIQDFLKIHDKYDIKKIDLLKINSIEILMNIINQAPSVSIRAFILSDEQKKEGYPFIKRLAQHLLYSHEQGIKIQVFEFMKALLDNENTDKKVEFSDFFYKEVLTIFLQFLAAEDDIQLDSIAPQDYYRSLEYNKSLEYSRSLVVQIFIKCASEHAFRFRIYAVQANVIEKISNLQKFKSKLINLWIVKFYKAIIKVKDDAFVMYLIKKMLLKTVIDIFIENPNKSNMIHSTILELFDYITKENNKKIANHLIQNYSEQLFKAPKYQHYFKSFFQSFDALGGGNGSYGASSSSLNKYGFKNGSGSILYTYQQREQMRKQDEDLIAFGERSSSFKSNQSGNKNSSSNYNSNGNNKQDTSMKEPEDDEDDDDDKYNQEMFLKRRQEEKQKQQSSPAQSNFNSSNSSNSSGNSSNGNGNGGYRGLLQKRKISQEFSSSEDEDDEAANDMGLFGESLNKFRQLQQERKNSSSPHKQDSSDFLHSRNNQASGSGLSPANRLFHRGHSPANSSNSSSAHSSINGSKNLIEFEIKTDLLNSSDQDLKENSSSQDSNNSNNGKIDTTSKQSSSVSQFLMNQDEFVSGGILVNPLTGKTIEGDEQTSTNDSKPLSGSLDSFDELEKSITQNKRQKIDININTTDAVSSGNLPHKVEEKDVQMQESVDQEMKDEHNNSDDNK